VSKNEVLVDTAHPMLVLKTKNCTKCNNTKYNPDNSTLFQTVKETTSPMLYRSSNLTTQLYMDKTCLNPGKSYCVHNYTFSGVVNATSDFISYDGIFGLGPVPNATKELEDDPDFLTPPDTSGVPPFILQLI
jgi:hypothetical protein